jgi:hypothetical protein
MGSGRREWAADDGIDGRIGPRVDAEEELDLPGRESAHDTSTLQSKSRQIDV